MAWGDTGGIVTVTQDNTVAWGSKTRTVDSVKQRQYIVTARVAEWGHSESSANTARDTLMETPDAYSGIQVSRVGSSGQYWLVYVTVTTTWETDPYV